MKQIILSVLLMLMSMLLARKAEAQADTISLSTKDLITANLKAGKNQYLVYIGSTKKKKIMWTAIWNRNVAFRTINGEEVIEIVQHWHSSDTSSNRYVYSTSRKKDFAPIYHKTKGKNGIEAFNFSGNEVTGSDTVSENSRKDLKVASSTSTLNWELDMEIFSTLPYKKEGQRFIINFYHPGGKTSPMYYEYKVIGSEKLILAGQRESDCWKLKIDYSPNSWAIFWIDKKSREVLKMQESWGSGYRYKVKFSTPVELTGI